MNNNRAELVAMIRSDGKFGAHIEGYERDVINLLYDVIIKTCERYERDPMDIILAYQSANAVNRGFVKDCPTEKVMPFDVYKMQEAEGFNGSENFRKRLEKMQAKRKEQEEELSKALEECEQILKELEDEKKKGDGNNAS